MKQILKIGAMVLMSTMLFCACGEEGNDGSANSAEPSTGMVTESGETQAGSEPSESKETTENNGEAENGNENSGGQDSQESQREPDTKEGDTIVFGSYEQDNNADNGAEPIEWIVLTKEADKMLVISRYGLDQKPYNADRKDVTWETCTMRSWLNGDFYNAAFSEEEKAKIVQVTNSNPDSNAFYQQKYGAEYEGQGAKGGNDTKDKVFLLNYEEALNFFAADEERSCAPTAYVLAKDEYGYGGWWWLRSPSYPQSYAMLISDVGAFSRTVVHDAFTVRPVLWISVQ